MKKLLLLSLSSLLTATSFGQVTVWSEDFENSCTSGCPAAGMNSGNGAWTVTNNSPSLDGCGYPTAPNMFYVSCAENGNAAGACGTTCSGDESLHIGSTTVGDNGASYDAGGWCDFGLGGWGSGTETDVRAESPTIDLTGYSNLTIDFVYMENGEGSLDDASLWYYDGSTWSMLDALAKTSPCGLQGTWTAFSMALPSSANNNPNVKIAFRWVNDDNGSGSDPSFAVDDVSITVPGPTESIATATFSPLSWCYGTVITDVLDFTAVGTYNAGNVFTAELSDASGSFASPQTVGTLSSSASGALSINITIPGTVPTGGGYRLRVVSSNPAIVGSDNGTDIVINAIPNVTLGVFSSVCVYTPSFTLTGGTPVGGTYSGPGITSGLFDPGTAGLGTHTVTYSYTDGNNCFASATQTIYVDECLGLDEVSAQTVVLYPNPASSTFSIAHPGTLEAISISDMKGRRIKTYDNTSADFTVDGLGEGVYFVHLIIDGRSLVKRLVIR